LAQPDGARFEVVSVRIAIAPGAGGATANSGSTGFSRSADPGLIRYAGTTLLPILAAAYGVKEYQVSGPAWIGQEHYDIVARIPEGASMGEVPGMWQNFLRERFRAKVHLENKPERVWALVVGRGGARLKKSSEPGAAASGGLPASLAFTPDGHLEFHGATLQGFAEILSRFCDRPVFDLTGIEGTFDMSLHASMADLAGLKSQVGPDSSADEPTGSIFAAIEDLGLKLESRQMPVKRVLVDEADRVPTSN
jgi:uncharacterized protein (TIGR03435 family)